MNYIEQNLFNKNDIISFLKINKKLVIKEIGIIKYIKIILILKYCNFDNLIVGEDELKYYDQTEQEIYCQDYNINNLHFCFYWNITYLSKLIKQNNIPSTNINIKEDVLHNYMPDDIKKININEIYSQVEKDIPEYKKQNPVIVNFEHTTILNGNHRILINIMNGQKGIEGFDLRYEFINQAFIRQEYYFVFEIMLLISQIGIKGGKFQK